MLKITTTNEAAAAVKPGKHRHVSAGKIALEIVTALIVIIALIPLVWVIFLSLKSNSEIFLNPLTFPQKVMWTNYVDAFHKIPFLKMLGNTGLEMVIAIPVSLTISIFSSFAIARIIVGKGKLNNFLYTYYISGIIIPGFVLMLPIYLMMNKIGLYDTILSMALTHIAWSAPMNSMLMVTMMRSVPSSLEEAAVIDGCGIWKVLFKIYVPIIKPTLITAFILMFLGMWNDFALARVLLISNENQTISLAVNLFKGLYSTDYALLTAGIVILTIPELIVFACLQKHIIDGIMEGAVKG